MYHTVSSKTGKNINKMFESILDSFIDSKYSEQVGASPYANKYKPHKLNHAKIFIKKINNVNYQTINVLRKIWDYLKNRSKK